MLKMEIPFTSPSDGWTQYEKLFLKDFILSIYKYIPNPVDKFILMAIRECSYTEIEVGKMIGISNISIMKRMKKIKKRLDRLKKNGIYNEKVCYKRNLKYNNI